MSKDTDKSLFIFSSMPRFYQHLLSGVASFEVLGNRILTRIRAAQAFRQVEQVRELARLLINIPIREYQLIAQYYLAWCKCRESEYHTDVLESIVEQSLTYKSKALTSRAAFEVYRGDTEQAFYFYFEALKASSTVSDYIRAVVGMATLKSIEGFHRSALADLEKIMPLLRHADPFTYFEIHNSYAAELLENNRVTEAENASLIAVSSPFGPFYPEMQATLSDARAKHKSRSTVTTSRPQEQPESEPKPEPKPKPESKPQRPASVVSFPPLKEAPPPQKPERLSPRELNELTANEKKELILAAIRSDTIRESRYDKLMDMVGLLKLGPADKVLDLEDDAVLDDIIILWSNQIDPEELAAVISALRDCDDSLRQRNIMDRIIRIAFEQTLLCTVTEDEWRRRVERRLPKT